MNITCFYNMSGLTKHTNLAGSPYYIVYYNTNLYIYQLICYNVILSNQQCSNLMVLLMLTNTNCLLDVDHLLLKFVLNSSSQFCYFTKPISYFTSLHSYISKHSDVVCIANMRSISVAVTKHFISKQSSLCKTLKAQFKHKCKL